MFNTIAINTFIWYAHNFQAINRLQRFMHLREI